MKALTFHGRGDVRCETVADPTIEDPRDVVVEVELSSICGSDLHVYHEREKGLDPGTVMGHEFTGRIVEVGSAVRGLRVGDRVASPFTTSCGSCFYCGEGLSARCERGSLFGWVAGGAGLQGAQAALVRVPLAETTLVRVPDGLSAEEALLLGDVLSTGFFCAAGGGVGPGMVVAAIGCGPVGLMGIVGAMERGAARVFAVDSVPERLDLARRFGALPVDFIRTDPLEVVREATGARGADVVMEMVGSPEAGRAAFRLVRPGGVISVAGVHTADRFPFTPAEAYDRNLTYRVGRCPARALMDGLIPLVLSRRYDLAAIVSHRLSLGEGPRAYEIFDRKREGCTKVVLHP